MSERAREETTKHVDNRKFKLVHQRRPKDLRRELPSVERSITGLSTEMLAQMSMSSNARGSSLSRCYRWQGNI